MALASTTGVRWSGGTSGKANMGACHNQTVRARPETSHHTATPFTPHTRRMHCACCELRARMPVSDDALVGPVARAPDGGGAAAPPIAANNVLGALFGPRRAERRDSPHRTLRKWPWLGRDNPGGPPPIHELQHWGSHAIASELGPPAPNRPPNAPNGCNVSSLPRRPANNA